MILFHELIIESHNSGFMVYCVTFLNILEAGLDLLSWTNMCLFYIIFVLMFTCIFVVYICFPSRVDPTELLQ